VKNLLTKTTKNLQIKRMAKTKKKAKTFDIAQYALSHTNEEAAKKFKVTVRTVQAAVKEHIQTGTKRGQKDFIVRQYFADNKKASIHDAAAELNMSYKAIYMFCWRNRIPYRKMCSSELADKVREMLKNGMRNIDIHKSIGLSAQRISNIRRKMIVDGLLEE
jgi:DNA-binding Lrp family transcriptional regulator